MKSHNEKECEKKYTHTQLNHLASYQKRTQHCKSTILEFKKKFKCKKSKTNAQGKVNNQLYVQKRSKKKFFYRTLQAFTGIEHAQFPPQYCYSKWEVNLSIEIGRVPPLLTVSS